MAVEGPRFLLLLPPSPSPLTDSSLKPAFGETITEVLKEVATHSTESPKAAVLEIALACPHLVQRRQNYRSDLYARTQSLVAGIYKLIVAIASKEAINVEDADGVDVRVLLLAWSSNVSASQPATDESPYGIVVSLESLAKSGRRWQYAFGHESSDGEILVKAFLSAKGGNQEVEHFSNRSSVEAPSTVENPQDTEQPSRSAEENSSKPHYHVAVGGTFDHIHIGHKLLLTMTIFSVDEDFTQTNIERSATIGITGDQLLKSKKYGDFLESWEDRYRAVMTFVNALIDFSPPASQGQRHVSFRDDPGPNGKAMDVRYPGGFVVKCVEIQDAFGPTITEEEISALVLSAETRAGGKAVNDRRREKGWKTLNVYEVDIMDAEEEAGAGKVQGFESKLSSTAIREKLAKKRQSSL